jgi:hypothetical protein
MIGIVHSQEQRTTEQTNKEQRNNGTSKQRTKKTTKQAKNNGTGCPLGAQRTTEQRTEYPLDEQKKKQFDYN